MAWHGPALLVWVASAELGRDGICGPACDLFVFLIIEQDRKRREQNGTESKESSAAAASIKGRASAVVRALLRRQTTRRRPLPRRPSNVFADKFAKLSEAERVEASKYLDQRDVETQRKLVQQVDLYLQSRPTSSNDAGLFDQVLTFFGVPKGESRAKLLRRANITGLFLVSWALGDWQARTYLLEQQEETTGNAV